MSAWGGKFVRRLVRPQSEAFKLKDDETGSIGNSIQPKGCDSRMDACQRTPAGRRVREGQDVRLREQRARRSFTFVPREWFE